MSVVVRAPAKINLQLSVGPLRDDGYHELVSVFHAVSLVDVITAQRGEGVQVSMSGEGQSHWPPMTATWWCKRFTRSRNTRRSILT